MGRAKRRISSYSWASQNQPVSSELAFRIIIMEKFIGIPPS